MVPGSTFRYGSSFCIVTRRPRERRSRPRLLAVRPLPREEATPPVTKMCRVVDSDRPESRCARSVTGFQPTRRTPDAGEPDGVSPDTSGVRQRRARVRGVRDGADSGGRGWASMVRKSRSVARSPAQHGTGDDERRDHRTARRGAERGDRAVAGRPRRPRPRPTARERADARPRRRARRPRGPAPRSRAARPRGAAGRPRACPPTSMPERAGLREREERRRGSSPGAVRARGEQRRRDDDRRPSRRRWR